MSSLGNDVAQKWKFGGKELSDEMDLNTYDFGARNYDPALGRWMNIDPLAEVMKNQSPFNYGFNNPVYFIDFDGRISKGFLNNPIVIFRRNENKVYIYDDNNTPLDFSDDKLIGSFDAHNLVTNSSKGIWRDGIFEMLDRFKPYQHSTLEPGIPIKMSANGGRMWMYRDSENGAYGSEGIYRAKPFKDTNGRWRSGMGFHAGREYKGLFQRRTNGCIRCEPGFFPAMEGAIKELGPWNITVVETGTGSETNNPKVDVNPLPIAPTPAPDPSADIPVITPPVVPGPAPTPEPQPVIIPPRPPDSGI